MRIARIGLRITLAVIGSSIVGAFAAVPAGAFMASSEELPDFDVRDHAATGDAQERAADRLGDRLGGLGFADADPTTGGLAFVGRTDSYLTGRSDASPAGVGLDYVRAHEAAFGLDEGDLAALSAPDSYTSIDGVTHVTWQQQSGGVDSYDTYLRANVTDDGRLINLSGAPVGDFRLDSANPALSASDALAAARRNIGGKDLAKTPKTEYEGAKLTAFAEGDGPATLAWRVQVEAADTIVYDVVVDATTGNVLARHSLTDFVANEATIWPRSASSTGTPVTVNLGADPTWIDRSAANGNQLIGNNAHAYADDNGTDGFQAGEGIPQTGTGDWLFATTFFTQPECPSFGCTWDSTNNATRATNRSDATSNLFWLVNNFHDHLLAPPIGFDEASRNFEQVNSTGQGFGNDAVHAEANDSSDINNADMLTLPDGSPPRMQMYLWNFNYDVNGSDSADVVYHEYTHGLTNRLVGNGLGLNLRQPTAMGEGWSDWYAMDELVGEGLETDSPGSGDVWLGEYVTGVPGLFGGMSRIRHQAIDCAVGASAALCPASGTASSGGYTCGDLGKVGAATSPHDNGEIWSQTLWDLRVALGRTDALAVVTGGLRLSPSDPSMLQERDAILQAAQNLGVNLTTVWQVFAGRGFGVNASTPSANSTACTEDFSTPGLRSTSIDDVTVTEGNAGQVTASLTVTATPSTGLAVSFNYATANGTATQPADYAQTSGSKTISGGASSTTIEIPVNGDTVDESDETFTVVLSGINSPNTIADGTGQVTISDDDTGGGSGTLDTTPPKTKIDSGPKAKTKKKRARFTFSANESPVAFQCKLDGGAFQACSSPATFRVKKGKHTLGVRAIDASVNVDPSPASYSWKVKKKRGHHH